MDQLTEHFSVAEMQCPCCKECKMDFHFMQILEDLRIDFGRPLRINSGYRCQKHNDTLPNSSPKSNHIKGLAADISWDEFDAEQKSKLLTYAINDFHGIGIGKSYVHVDLGGARKVWIY